MQHKQIPKVNAAEMSLIMTGVLNTISGCGVRKIVNPQTCPLAGQKTVIPLNPRAYLFVTVQWAAQINAPINAREITQWAGGNIIDDFIIM